MAYTLANGSSPVSAPRPHRRKNAYRRISVNRSGYRFYHSGIGRWMSRDPMGQVGSAHWFDREQILESIRQQARAGGTEGSTVAWGLIHIAAGDTLIGDEYLYEMTYGASYGFVHNTPVYLVDMLGRMVAKPQDKCINFEDPLTGPKEPVCTYHTTKTWSIDLYPYCGPCGEWGYRLIERYFHCSILPDPISGSHWKLMKEYFVMGICMLENGEVVEVPSPPTPPPEPPNPPT